MARPLLHNCSGRQTPQDTTGPAGARYDTGVDLDLLLGIAHDLPAIVGHDVPGQVMKAGTSDRTYPKPAGL